VAILSAMETVCAKVPSIVEAAALCKMAYRGQIIGALLDGPLALDNAISPQAASLKQIVSPVAGRANVLWFQILKRATCWPRACRFGASRCCRNRAGRTGADHPDLPRRRSAHAPRVASVMISASV
jgi:phosphate acetyltransferase